MTSRERLLAVIRHQMPDRVPISTYEMRGWNINSCENEYCGSISRYVHHNIDFPYMTGWQTREPSYASLIENVKQKTDCMYMTDVRTENTYIKNNTHIEQWNENNSTFTRITIVTPKGDLTRLYRVDAGIKAAWQLEHPIKTDDDISKYFSIPDDLERVNVGHLKTENEYLGDKGILMIDINDPLGVIFDLFDFGDYTVKAYTEKETFTKLLDKVFEQQMFFLEDMLKKGAGPLFRIVGPEVATAPYLSPQYFHDYVCKYDRQMIRLIHDYGQYARIHCHGRIKDILPHIIEMEADAIDPVEAPPSGDIELSEVKRLYGDKLCIMGNIQLKDLELASPEEMKRITMRCMEDAKAGGNFVIMPTATPINIPLSPISERNIKIFIDTAFEYGCY